LKLELPPPGLLVFHDHVRAEDVGRHQIGGKLDAVELQVENVGQRPHQHRFAQPRHALEQAVAADQDRGQHPFDDLVVTDDHAADLLADQPKRFPKLRRLGRHRIANSRHGKQDLVSVPNGPAERRADRVDRPVGFWIWKIRLGSIAVAPNRGVPRGRRDRPSGDCRRNGDRRRRGESPKKSDSD